MTIVNSIEIDCEEVAINEIQQAIVNNDPIESKLHVIAVISNPCQYARRYILARHFVNRMEQKTDIILYIVELAYENQQYHITEKNNPRHLQLRTKTPLWHKENMINIGIKNLLPKNWKAVAWIDADIEFENPWWASDALKVLNGSRDVIQLFSHAVDMDKSESAMSIFPSFGYQFTKKAAYGKSGINMWHPGYAWACTRKAYEKMGGLYELSILGSGDHNMSFSFIGKAENSLNINTSTDYKQSLTKIQSKANMLRLGYVPGIIRHFFHGSKKNRKYAQRWEILVRNNYEPTKHITTDSNGILVPTSECPQQMLKEIYLYFAERNEDEYYNK